MNVIDPVCLSHQRRQSEHVCAICCLCFRDLTHNNGESLNEELCNSLPEGGFEDVCRECAALEAEHGG